ncbi:hypothetical protein Y032_0670g1371 [Ancylostoma ceylanicum]|uniref:Peptidase A1 domain-containing protein n=1 Tax=Ancylostoma ceylanicum TaxID=53326 RepID=A0A016WJK1_9BILA|nr:hypothetical protein Y032_0670g1371 [Ancylostoma ceylanicum]
MHLFVILALASVATCTALQSTLIRREPKTFQLIRNGKYPEYLKKLKSTQTAAGAGANVYRADFEIAQRVAIGTPPQEALAWLCTQASIMWVPHVDCRSYWRLELKGIYE